MTFLQACGSLSPEESTSPIDPAQAGSVLGTPVSTQSKLVFADATPPPTAILTSEALCKKINQIGNQQIQTVGCMLTSDSHAYGILAIDLVACNDASGNNVVCEESTVISQRERIYDGTLVHTPFSSSGHVFSGNLASVNNKITVGGIQFVIAYIEEAFPSPTTNPVDAAMVAESLHGKSFRYCTSPQENISIELFEIYCAGAHLSTKNETDDETDPLYFNWSSFGFAGQDSITTEDWYPVAGFFAPGFSLSETVTLDVGQGVAATLPIDRSQSLKFIDGAAGMATGGGVCVEKHAGIECIGGDDDPLTPFVYDPEYDGSIRLVKQEVTVEINDL